MTPRRQPAEPAPSHRPSEFLRPALLLLLAERPTYGYQLLKELEEFGCPSDVGALYRTLRALERDGLVRSRMSRSDAGPDRYVYRVTAAGLRALDESAANLGDTKMQVTRFLHRHARLAIGIELPSHRLGPVSEALQRLAAS